MERLGYKQTQISDPNCLVLYPGDSKNLATPSPLPHPPRAQQPLSGRTIINPSLTACWAESMESHSYSSWLMFYRFYRGGQSSWVICVIAGGKGTIKVGCQSGGGCVQGMRNTLVCMQWLLAHAHLKRFGSHILCHMHQPAKQTRTLNEQNHTCMCITDTHMHKYDPMLYFTHHHWICRLFTPPILFTLSYSEFANFWSVTYGIYHSLRFLGEA